MFLMKPPKKVGDRALIRFMAECIMCDWIVLTPFGDCDRYDCVIDRNNGEGFKKVQVKTGRYKNGAIHFPTCSTKHYVRDGDVIHSKQIAYIKKDVDFFGVFCFEINKCYLIPIENTCNSSCSLRVEISKNNQKSNINYASKYEINAFEINKNLTKEYEKYYCKNCGIEIQKRNKSKLCVKCVSKDMGIKRRKVKNRPSKEQLLKEVNETSYVAVGKKYNVSNNTIKKWIRAGG